MEIVPASPELWPSIEGLFSSTSTLRWCWCQFWRMRSKDFAEQRVSGLRARLRAQAEGDLPPGLVALDGERAVGWVSLGPRADFERIVRSRVIRAIDDRPVWSVVCFAVSPEVVEHASDPSASAQRVVVRLDL